MFMLSVTSLMRSTNLAVQVTDWLTFSEPSSAVSSPSLYLGRLAAKDSAETSLPADVLTASLTQSCWVKELKLRSHWRYQTSSFAKGMRVTDPIPSRMAGL